MNAKPHLSDKWGFMREKGQKMLFNRRKGSFEDDETEEQYPLSDKLRNGAEFDEDEDEDAIWYGDDKSEERDDDEDEDAIRYGDDKSEERDDDEDEEAIWYGDDKSEENGDAEDEDAIWYGDDKSEENGDDDQMKKSGDNRDDGEPDDYEDEYEPEEAANRTKKAEDSADKPVIVFRDVVKEYDDSVGEEERALKGVSFRINKGEFVFIVGPSGSGKSTLIRLLMREIRPTSGSIYIAGTELNALKDRNIYKFRRGIGIVFQDFRLLEDRTVYENIAFAQKAIGAPSRKISRNVGKMLTLVGLKHKYRSYPNKLSGGEQQRVALARALVNNPTILLADEPTGNLDPTNTEEIMELLEEINNQGTTVVVVTHNKEIVDRMQKRVIVLKDGRIVEDKKGGYTRG